MKETVNYEKFKKLVLPMLIFAVIFGLVSCGEGKTPDEGGSDSNAKWKNIKSASDITFDDKNLTYMGIAGTEDWIQRQVKAFEGLGGKIEFIPTIWEQRMQQLANKVTTKEAPDLFKCEPSAGEWPALITSGLVMSIDGLIDYNSPLFKPFKEYAEQYKIDGKMYALPFAKGPLSSYLYYNKKVFEDNGLPTPFELYSQKKWTIDKMHEMAKELTTVKDGAVQNYGLYCVDETPFIAATGRDIIKKDKNGKLVNNIKDPLIAKALERVQKMAVDESCLIMDKTVARDMMLNGKVAMWAGGSWESDNFKVLLQKGDIEFVPFPRDSLADDWYLDGSIFCDYIPQGAKNPDAALAWIAVNIELGNDKEFLSKSSNEFVSSRNMPKSFTAVYDKMTSSGDMKLNILIYKSFPEFTEKWTDAFWNDFYSEKIPWSTIAEKLSPAIDETIAKINARS